ncbi:hypothetical protein AC1031_011118 [Aphanomyces cochlioides]|nr:hypothetical protein AC1031_011118 [Aphanomyces cochlioides]
MSRGVHVDAIWSIVQGRYDASELERLLRGASIAGLDMDGWTPLHYACDNRQVTSVQPLLQAGASVNATDEGGYTPLHLLCKNSSGDFTAIPQLLAAGASPNIASTDGKHVTPLHLLCTNEAVTSDAVISLMKARADVNAVDGDGNTPLHYLCTNHAVSDSVLTPLMQRGTHVDVQNNFQSTPLHYLCQNANVTPRMISLFWDLHANPNIRDNIGNTALHSLCENAKASVALLDAFMTSKSVDPTLTNSSGKRAFDLVASGDCAAFVQRFIPQMTQPTSASSTTPGGEDLIDLPDSLCMSMKRWNDSLPPFDEAFYNAVSCEPAFESIYGKVQEASFSVATNPGDKHLVQEWETQMQAWRRVVVRAFLTLVHPQMWPQYAQTFQRSVPSDVIKIQEKIEAIWSSFPDATQRRQRLEAIDALVL